VVVPALIWLQVALWRRRYGDADVSVRRERYGFYLFGLACMVSCYAVLLWLEAPDVLRGGFRAALLAALVSAAANRYWAKISVHAGALAGAAALAAPYSWPLALLLGASGAAVTWARIALGRHTLTEALAGWAIAVGCVLAAGLTRG
jgi:membrane-associated phospholipid phosphatase